MKCSKLIICGFTKIYLYRFYIPELISRLANDVQLNNPGPGIANPTKTIAAPYSQGNVEVFGTANAVTQRVAIDVSVGTCLKFQESNNLFS